MINFLEPIEPLTNEQLNKLAVDETERKTHWLIYPEKKGKGAKITARGDNGDILTWNKNGTILNVEKDVVAARKTRGRFANRTYTQTVENIRPPATKNRRDFAGNGNIIGWC